MMYVSLTRKKAVEVESFTAASIAVRKFIELNDYGSSVRRQLFFPFNDN
jgi:hypothetical protein